MEKTIYDVARLAGVSTATVSRVINKIGNVSPKREAKVRLAMEKLNYSPNALAQGFASNKSKTIGLVINLPETYELDLVGALFFTELFRGVNTVIRQKGYYLMIINEKNKLENIVKDFLDNKRIDGLIIGFLPMELSELREAIGKERPLAYIGNIHNYERGLHVYAQYTEYLDDILLYFKSRGHERLAFLSSRSKEFLDNAWGAANCTGAEGLDISYIKYEEDKFRIEDIRELFSGKNSPTGIFIEHIGLIQPITTVLGELGLRIPEDVSIVSVEHVKGMGENFSPKITSMYVPVFEMGKAAITLLLEYIEGESDGYDKRVNIQPVLMERDSVIEMK